MRVPTPFEQYIALVRIRYTAARRNRLIVWVGVCLMTLLLVVNFYLLGERTVVRPSSLLTPFFAFILVISGSIYVQVDCTLLKTLLEFAEAFQASEAAHNDERS